MRTEYLGRFLSRLQVHTPSVGQYFLAPLSRIQLEEAILRPTKKRKFDDLDPPYEHYNFSYQPGVVPKILDQFAGTGTGDLAALQTVCTALYERGKLRNKPWQITLTDLESIGGVGGSIERFLDQQLVDCGREAGLDQEAIGKEIDKWKEVLCGLSRLQPNNTITTDLQRENVLRKDLGAASRLDFDTTTDKLLKTRLLREVGVVDAENGKLIRCLGLGHDTLGLVLRNWKIRRRSEASDRQLSQARKEVDLVTRSYLLALHALTKQGQAVHDSLASGRMSTGTAREHLVAAEEILRQLPNPEDPKLAAQLAELMNKLSVGLIVLDQMTLASAVLERTLELLKHLDGRVGADKELLFQYVTAWHIRGDLGMACERRDRSLDDYKVALGYNETLIKNDPNNRRWKLLLSVSLNKVGDALLAQGFVKEAGQNYAESLRVSTALLNDENENPEFLHAQSISLCKHADAWLADSQAEKAKCYYVSSLRSWERLLKRDPSNVGWQRDASYIHERMGDIFAMQGDTERALDEYRHRLSVLSKLIDRDPEHRFLQDELSGIKGKLLAHEFPSGDKLSL